MESGRNRIQNRKQKIESRRVIEKKMEPKAVLFLWGFFSV